MSGSALQSGPTMYISIFLVVLCALHSSHVTFRFQMLPPTPYNWAVSLSYQVKSNLPHSSVILPKNSRSQGGGTPLAMPMDGDSSLNKAMIHQIDQKIQEFKKQQQKYATMVKSARVELKNEAALP